MAGVDIMSVMFSMQRSCSIEVSQIINLNILYAQYKNKKRKDYQHISETFVLFTVRSNTRYVHLAVTPSAARQLNRRLCPHRGIKGCGDRTIVCVGF